VESQRRLPGLVVLSQDHLSTWGGVVFSGLGGYLCYAVRDI
jgi:hypothetical protein